MRRELAWIQSGLSVAALICLFLLPAYNFVLIIPIIKLTGWDVATKVNQLMYIPMLLTVLMITASVMNHRISMEIFGALEIVTCVLLIVFRKNMVMDGSLSWISTVLQRLSALIGPDLHLDIPKETYDTAMRVIRAISELIGKDIPSDSVSLFVYLLQKFGHVVGTEITTESVLTFLNTIVSDSLQIGIGLILHLACTLVYEILGFAAPQRRDYPRKKNMEERELKSNKVEERVSVQHRI